MINASRCKVGQAAVQHESMDKLFPVFNLQAVFKDIRRGNKKLNLFPHYLHELLWALTRSHHPRRRGRIIFTVE